MIPVLASIMAGFDASITRAVISSIGPDKPWRPIKATRFKFDAVCPLDAASAAEISLRSSGVCTPAIRSCAMSIASLLALFCSGLSIPIVVLVAVFGCFDAPNALAADVAAINAGIINPIVLSSQTSSFYKVFKHDAVIGSFICCVKAIFMPAHFRPVIIYTAKVLWCQIHAAN
jgi:hypothetical protein